jgi:transcriptional regulator with XRE-family HTH domain
MKTDIIDQLRKAIDESGESQLAIAKAARIGQSGLNRFMNGDRGISLETAAKLCDHLKLTLVRR